MKNKDHENKTPFEILAMYTRKQALADGVQVDISKTAEEVGIHYPIFITRAVFDTYVAVPQGVIGQDEAGRLWDLVWMLRFAILKSPHTDRLPFQLYVKNDNIRARLVTLIAVCGPIDVDNAFPCITVMMPDED